jgi:ATP-dependent helicase/nuclease subunit A
MLHPILTHNFSYSTEQEAALKAATAEVLVTAGAGAGKTRTLVARYLAMLAEGIPMRSVIAITFTRKAAREMRNRIRQQIRSYLATDGLPAHERSRWDQLYGELDGARIGTIHSLCAEILRFHPAQANVDPNFELLDEGVSSLLRQQAVEEALAWAAENPDLLPLFSILGQWSLQNTLVQLLLNRLSAAESFTTSQNAPLSRWQAEIEQQQLTVLATMESGEAWRQAVETLRHNSATDDTDLMEIQRVSALAAIDGPGDTVAGRLESVAGLGQINRRGGRAKAWPDGKPQLTAIKKALQTLHSAWEDNAELLQLATGELDEQLAGLIPLLKQLFDVAIEQYNTLKVRRNTLDYDDLEMKTLQLLANYREAREYWQSNINSIMVDEFQDTNQRQADLIQSLQGPSTHLFLVGDAKQSIYRFRGADVSVFRRKESKAQNVCRLQTSYRAHYDLIVSLNDVFRPVLGEPDAATPDYVEPFSKLIPWRENPALGISAPYIELGLALGSKSDGALERAAAGLAQRLLRLLAETQLTPADIAILCRSSTSFAAYENALEAAGLPFLTVAGRGFYHRPEVRDVLNALHALTDPTDDLALAGLLRSPVLGVSDAGLYWLTRLTERQKQSLWDVIQMLPTGSNLSVHDLSQVAAAVALIGELRRDAGRTAIADLLKAFLDRTNYRAALIRAGQQRAARNLSKLLADAHNSGLVNANDFLEYIAGLRDSGSREGEARAIEEGVITIMSVHAAKGLEFPVVVVGDITHTGRSSYGTIVTPQSGPLLPLKNSDGDLPAIYRLARWVESNQEDAESRRLLYVAATRAREKLILNGVVSVGKNGHLTRTGEWLRLLTAPLNLGELSVEFDPEGNHTLLLDLPTGQLTLYEPGWQPPAVSWPATNSTAPQQAELPQEALLAALPAAKGVTTAPAQADLPERVFQIVPPTDKSAAPTWVVGSLVHEALALWRFPTPTFQDWAVNRSRTYGLTDAHQINDAASRCSRLLTQFQASSLYQAMTAATQRLHEIPYSIMVDGHPESGRVDALFQTGDRWTLVDFKVDRVYTQTRFMELLEGRDYLAKLSQYRQAVTELTGHTPAALLCLLDYERQARTFSLETLYQIVAGQQPNGEATQ